ncbi:transmembrane protein 26-like [Haliotis rufescens]|uniref:transmembrane protein 26-like n=1 Tax=Haliotis rufescens TaxID=6454 RepID=UPI001EAFA5FF|nr:transmembrane protein 26-like [Haliotis rufescens]
MKISYRLRTFLSSLFVRLMLLTHTLIACWRAASSTNNEYYWLLAAPITLQLIEFMVMVTFRKGVEGLWFCPCFFFYLLSTVPAIWILELDRLARYTEIYESSNSSSVESLSAIQGVSLPITLSPSLWMSVIEQSFLFLIIIGRWILPRGELTRDKLSQLLFVYIGMASDIMDLFVLFEEPDVRKDRIYTYVILVLWSISLLQFSIVLTATKSPKKSRPALVHPEDEFEEEKKKTCGSCCGCLKTEIWSLLLSFLMQDGPFLTCRLYGLIRYNLITYSIIFYTCKNLFVVMLLIYRLLVLCCFENESETDKAAHRAVRKAAMVRGMSTRAANARIALVEEDYANGGSRRQGARRSKGRSMNSPTTNQGQTRIVEVE